MSKSGRIAELNTAGTSPVRKKPNYFYSIISVALVLFLIGLFGMILLHGHQLVKVFKENVNVLVELKTNSQEQSIQLFQEKLAAQNYVKPGSVVFTSKETAASLLKEDLGEDIELLGFQNPLYDMLSFNIRSDFMQADSLANIKQRIAQHPAVSDVYYEEGLVEGLSRNVEKLGFISLIIALLFMIVAITLIHNTIRLALYANRFLIKNMQLVGASWGFISRPYLWFSLRNALISSLCAIGGLYTLLLLAHRDLPELANLTDWRSLSGLFFGLLLIGIIITFSSTFFVVNRYLQMRVDDLY